MSSDRMIFFQVYIDDMLSDDNEQDLQNYNFARYGFRNSNAASCNLTNLVRCHLMTCRQYAPWKKIQKREDTGHFSIFFTDL